MAVSLVGSAHEVMAYMKSSEDEFRDYCAGLKEPPFEELDRLVALIVREQGKMIAKNRDLLAGIRAKKPRL